MYKLIPDGLAEGMKRILFPPQCPCCGTLLSFNEYESGFCGSCRKSIQYIHEPACKICGKKLNDKTSEYCFDCSKNKHIFQQSKAVYVYSGGIKKAMYRLKYGNRKEYARIFARDMARMHEKFIRQKKIDLVVPVPMNGAKRRERGYDQAALLAKELAEQTGLAFSDRTLIRIKRTRPQKELNDTERRKNLKNAFKIGQSVVKSKKVLLVDDIYTTGSTMDACAEVLMNAGAKAVYGMTVVVGDGI